MATKSICKNLTFKDKKLTRGLINALENASNYNRKEVQMSKNFKEVKKSDLRKYFNF